MTLPGLGDIFRGPLRKGQDNSQKQEAGKAPCSGTVWNPADLHCHFPATQPEAGYLASPCPSFHIYIMGVIYDLHRTPKTVISQSKGSPLPQSSWYEATTFIFKIDLLID